MAERYLSAQVANFAKKSIVFMAGVLACGPFSARSDSSEVPRAQCRMLFVCTGNRYRSRLAEAQFNFLAAKAGLSWRAQSRGFSLDPVRNPGNVAQFAVSEMERLKIPVEYLRPTEAPQPVTASDLRDSDIVILMSGEEHQPYFRRLFPDLPSSHVRAWAINDVEIEPPESAAPKINEKLRELISELSDRDRHKGCALSPSDLPN